VYNRREFKKDKEKTDNAGQELSFFRGMSKIPARNRDSLNSFFENPRGIVVSSQASKNPRQEWLFSVQLRKNPIGNRPVLASFLESEVAKTVFSLAFLKAAQET
jgi:hypothetical protein